MTHSDRATQLVKDFEGFSSTAYQDGNGIWTCGYGHTEGVREGDTCTLDQATRWLDHDLQTADRCIAGMVKVPINQNRWDALTSFIYNIGCGNFSHSTVHFRINQGDFTGACEAIGMWNKVNHEVSPGLVRRRAAEQNLFSEAM